VQLNFPTGKKFTSSDLWQDFVHLFRNEHELLPSVWADV
jgi:hypothetical protein